MILQLFFAIFFAYSVAKMIRRRMAKPNYIGKNVWITGASSGIGQYLAYEFSRAGANLILTARNVKQLNRVKESCQNPNNVEIVPLDMTNYDAIEKTTESVVQKLENEGKRIDVVIENAGISMRTEFRQLEFKDHLNIFDVNVNGPVKHIKCLLNHMIKNKSGQIVAITSATGKLSSAFRSSYSGSKHALIGIFDSLRSEFHEYGITLTNIMPGYVRTRISLNAVGDQGKKFGATDSNIETGMKPDIFAKKALAAIYTKQSQIQISQGLAIPFGIFMRNICPDFIFAFLRLNRYNQIKAIAKGKENKKRQEKQGTKQVGKDSMKME